MASGFHFDKAEFQREMSRVVKETDAKVQADLAKLAKTAGGKSASSVRTSVRQILRKHGAEFDSRAVDDIVKQIMADPR